MGYNHCHHYCWLLGGFRAGINHLPAAADNKLYLQTTLLFSSLLCPHFSRKVNVMTHGRPDCFNKRLGLCRTVYFCLENYVLFVNLNLHDRYLGIWRPRAGQPEGYCAPPGPSQETHTFERFDNFDALYYYLFSFPCWKTPNTFPLMNCELEIMQLQQWLGRPMLWICAPWKTLIH